MICEYLSRNKVKVDLIDEEIINDLMAQEAGIMGEEGMTDVQALAADGVEEE